MNWQQLLAFGLHEAGLHFWFSACVGLGVFALTSTILLAVRRAWNGTALRSIAAKSSTIIFGTALCLALFVAWDSHGWLDAWYRAPIDAPLVLDTSHNPSELWQEPFPVPTATPESFINQDPNRYNP